MYMNVTRRKENVLHKTDRRDDCDLGYADDRGFCRGKANVLLMMSVEIPEPCRNRSGSKFCDPPRNGNHR
ncbi:hypothetical protein CEXT_559731 [Caerostris extrusa]|uniref:Uncharacterized protein n=1 Tax=Caerostris extrusa TaxID=172846 RepID=A0AAV4VTM7_CAEEX|nr:hypothetical protein CEXT_559731 [Caerostris extrusa]